MKKMTGRRTDFARELEIRKHAELQRDKDPVYWGEMLRVIDRGFKLPDAVEYKKWLRTVDSFSDLETAWVLTDEYVSKTRDKSECYPVIFCAFGPVRISTPRLPECVGEGHPLLGFVTIKEGETAHPADPDGCEPVQLVDEVFVLPCWKTEEVEVMLRGCFLYA